MILIELIGWLGLTLIVLAWIPAIVESIKRKKATTPLKFTLIYFLGSLTLTIYAILRLVWPFIVLNGLAALLSFINLYYAIKGSKIS